MCIRDRAHSDGFPALKIGSRIVVPKDKFLALSLIHIFTSVIGAAYTSVSFLKTVHPVIAKNDKWFIVGFIAFSTLVMAILGGAKRMVILAGRCV